MPEEVGKPIVVTSVVDGHVNRSQLEFTNTMLNGRRLIRSQKNPMDRCTIVSIFPKELNEIKHTIEPGHFHVNAGSFETPAITVVGSSSWWKDIDVDQPMLEIPVSSIQIADSVIKDFCNGMLGCNMADSMPGLFFVLGEQTVAKIKTEYKEKLKEVNDRQNNWYKILVRLADSLWARSNGNPLVICDEMRMGAKALNFNEKPWLKDFMMVEKVTCKACGTLKSPEYPVCPHCRAVDMTHPTAKDLKFALQ
jgi:hypothetical protein